MDGWPDLTFFKALFLSTLHNHLNQKYFYGRLSSRINIAQ